MDLTWLGGPALTLYWGHRKSIDIALFSDFSFDAAALLEQIQQDYHFELFLTEPNTLKGSINNVKVDFIDIWYALNKYDIPDMIGFYMLKYNQPQTSHILKSLIYFDDVVLADWPELLKDPEIEWEDIKIDIEKKVLLFIKSVKK